MPEYRVTVAIDENATSPRDAAQQAKDDLLALGPRVNRFTVIDLHSGVKTVVELDGSEAGRERPSHQRPPQEGR